MVVSRSFGWLRAVVLGAAVAWIATPSVPTGARGQTATVFVPPEPTHILQNTSFTVIGNVGYVPTWDVDRIWSFHTGTGELVDPDGLVAFGRGARSFVFSESRLVFPSTSEPVEQGLQVVDVSARTMTEVGVIPAPVAENEVAVDPDGVTGYVLSYEPRAYSFSVDTMSLLDSDGVALPATALGIGVIGDWLVMSGGGWDQAIIMVVDASDPTDLTMAGVIEFPVVSSIGSAGNLVFNEKLGIGFLPTLDGVLYSFNPATLTLVDPDGVVFCSEHGRFIAIHGTTIACVHSDGVTFVDVTDPSDMTVISVANFGEQVSLQGGATAAFSRDGRRCAVPIVYPGSYVCGFDVATGDPLRPWFPVGEQPNVLDVFGPDDRVGVVCGMFEKESVWLIDGLLDPVAVRVPDPPTTSLGLDVRSPFSATTSIVVRVPNAEDSTPRVSLGVYDAGGRLLRTLLDRGDVASGRSVVWDGTDTSGRQVASGVYFVRLNHGHATATERAVLLR